jgi:hypothetical protein
MDIPPKDKWGNLKNINPFKKNYKRKKFPRSTALYMKFYRQRSLEDKIRGLNPKYYDLFLSPIELQKVKASVATGDAQRTEP